MLGTIMWRGFTIIPPVAIVNSMRVAMQQRKQMIVARNKVIEEAKKGNPQAQQMLMFMQFMDRMQSQGCGCAECDGHCHEE